MYVWYNNLLRYLSAAYDFKLSPFDDYKQEGGNPFPFKTTLHVLNSAIIKLSIGPSLQSGCIVVPRYCTPDPHYANEYSPGGCTM